MQRKGWTLAVVLTALLAVCLPAFAHHGGAAYDAKNPLTLKGTVTDFKFINPHVQIYFDAPDEQGNPVHWNCESIDPAMLMRQGWTHDILKPGDKITITGNPAKSGAKVMVLRNLVLANGTQLESKYLY
jgi:hypothetical protein